MLLADVRQVLLGFILYISDLQVKVFPTTEGLTVTLMCSTSCPLTEKAAAFIWYKNREFLYEDWSPWYQELVSGEEAVRYSCAIKGYEELRAPEVSVDSVSSTCFSVTYAKGRMCFYKRPSVDESCSIKFPRALHVQRTPSNKYVKLTCNISCPLTDTRTALTWYKNGFHYSKSRSIPLPSNDSFSCAAKGLEHHQSAEVCAEVQKCRSVNYVSRRICALQGSSVNISSKYSHPDTQQPTSKLWYKKNRSGKEELVEASGDVEDYDERNNHHHILTIKNLKKNDSAQYTFRLQREDGGLKESFLHGVLLTVTDLQVKFTPSAEVTEGQRVTLTCSTSCPLTDNTNYIWYFNSRPLTLPEHQNKHLLLDPVSSQRAGNYSCAVRTNKNFNSAEKSLTVQSMTGTSAAAAAAGVAALLLVITPLVVFFWIR
ncbi:uncharacterized protein [Brachyistius frenatus]|uniref:uncharacterized protein n=1 Tax=Brachyistius frenatus TaxID=100188 RepID=UPI0037E9AA23